MTLVDKNIIEKNTNTRIEDSQRLIILADKNIIEEKKIKLDGEEARDRKMSKEKEYISN